MNSKKQMHMDMDKLVSFVTQSGH